MSRSKLQSDSIAPDVLESEVEDVLAGVNAIESDDGVHRIPSRVIFDEEAPIFGVDMEEVVEELPTTDEAQVAIVQFVLDQEEYDRLRAEAVRLAQQALRDNQTQAEVRSPEHSFFKREDVQQFPRWITVVLILLALSFVTLSIAYLFQSDEDRRVEIEKVNARVDRIDVRTGDLFNEFIIREQEMGVLQRERDTWEELALDFYHANMQDNLEDEVAREKLQKELETVRRRLSATNVELRELKMQVSATPKETQP